MRWFGNAIPLIAMGKKTVKQPVHVSLFKGSRYSNILPNNKLQLSEINARVLVQFCNTTQVILVISTLTANIVQSKCTLKQTYCLINLGFQN